MGTAGKAFREFQYPSAPLEPVRGLQLDTLLSGSDEAAGNEELLARLAKSTGLVLDVAGAVA